MSQPGAPDDPPSHYQELKEVLKEQQEGTKDNAKIVVPKALHAQAIAISHD